nr:MAG TPA: hypothetical protein [Caudoviricetes sp.]
MAQKRLKSFSGIVLRAYHINVSERNFWGKSGNNKKRDWLSSVPFYILQIILLRHVNWFFEIYKVTLPHRTKT